MLLLTTKASFVLIVKMAESLPVHVIPVVPRRYEDTKPALNQAFTHDAILDIGNKLALQTQQLVDYEKTEALKKCKQEAWKQAEQYKEECVEKALKVAKIKQDKLIARLNEQHEKVLKKEISRVEGIMQQRGREQVFEEQLAGERKINDMVAKLHTNFAEKKASAVQSARDEERNIAQNHKQELISQHEEALKDQQNRDEEHKLFKLEELRSVMSEEKRQAVLEAEKREKDSADQRVKEVTAHFQNIVQQLNDVIEERARTQQSTEKALSDMEILKNSYVDKLKNTRNAFVAFAESCRPDFFEQQADFLIEMNVIDPDDDV
ncbi:uncharacterized protein LOC143459850 [Clavelina lepadiformis]|uniref:uncharacterized protein LOC143459850 n=1 Tax=Clavelina lepadiformis TaxID=159417 RepID=UPI0040427684